MKEIVINLGNKSNEIQIVPIGDLHVGDPNCNMDLIKSTIKYIKDTENCYTILNGDLMNNALKTSKSDTYKETMNMEEQQEALIELLSPIKDKILFMTQGNHELRTNLLAGIDPLRYVARSLDLIEKGRYSDNTYMITLMFGKRNGEKNSSNIYTIFGTHGSGGGKRVGSTANAMDDMCHIIPNADLYVHSHTHVPINYSDRVFVYNQNNKKLEVHTRTFFNTNSFVEYGGYAEAKGYKVSDTTPSAIVIKMIRNGGTMKKLTSIVRL